MATRRSESKFDDKKAEQILSLLSEGNFVTDAAALVGVSARTVERWIERGNAGKEPYKTFAENVARARAQFIVVSLRELKASKGAERAALMWHISKIRPRQFGDRVQHHVESALNDFLSRAEAAFPPDVYERILEVAAGESGAEEAL